MKRFVAGLVIATLGGLLYVYEEIEAVKIGYFIRKKEESKTQALDRARALKYNIARLESPRNLEQRLSAAKIELGSPKAWQTLVMPGAETRSALGGPLEAGGPPLWGKFFVGTARAEAKESG